MQSEIQILPLSGIAVGFLYYDTKQEDDYDEEDDMYYQHYTILLFIIAIRFVRW